jgi:hypothetical protein
MERFRRLLARCLAVLVAPLLLLGVMVPASSAARVADRAAGRAMAAASLQAAIRKSLGTAVSSAGWFKQAELSGPNGEFGQSVSVSASGSTALVGTPNLNTGTGAAYVFTLRHGHWSRTAELTAADGAQFSAFGGSVTLSATGSTALVAARLHNKNTGAVYVFTLRQGHWHQTAELTAADAAPGDTFGFSVALSASGSTALVSAIAHHSETGAAYVFTLRHGTWSQTAELTAADAAPENDFGQSVALSAAGTTALVGDSVRDADAGAVYVFTLRHRTWSQTAELTAAANDGLGLSVALSAAGTTILAGAPFHNTSAGAAYMFTLRHSRWSQTAELTDAATGGDFGYSVALSALGTTALVEASEGTSSIGAADVFTLRHRSWSRTAKLTDAVSGDSFGISVALSALGTTALVGAPYSNNAAGAVYVFKEGRGAR